MSARLLSNDSKQCLLIIGASSQMIRDASFTKSAASVPGVRLHRENSSGLIGIPNLECAVLPPCNRSEAIPLEATFKTISPLDLIAADNNLHRNVFPVPPNPYTKKTPPFFSKTASMISSYIFFCSSVNFKKSVSCAFLNTCRSYLSSSIINTF
ncbi:hypothetical protein BRARA_I02586 [Brassica rapa]|uniref:Uncharacterized protein n=1 Tax=Brassica campestris TaxID=3711 RepID=A0A397XWZ9_BRACM|nr:hypothetical protein BRARA_I02586 [Brassica rapa]